MPDGGYSFETGALDDMASKLRDGAEALDQAATAQAEAPDAGASSPYVARALQALMTSTVAGAQALDDIAEKINVAQGSYHTIENTHEGAMEKQQHDTYEDWGEESMGERNIPLN
ncbi:hypothetical protein [Amycolatopsis palatopharyngis]|uniref:hypothetical protein n=1 Tax=Amycolatopsis palatopharyngis TaxID=187982 RepID=UPI000E26FC1A|nr:hypothetical protein [Amycolatopsis palatopharyngis]